MAERCRGRGYAGKRSRLHAGGACTSYCFYHRPHTHVCVLETRHSCGPGLADLANLLLAGELAESCPAAGDPSKSRCLAVGMDSNLRNGFGSEADIRVKATADDGARMP
eukprot:122502-Chlamydomonas_euryale.AAC.2